MPEIVELNISHYMIGEAVFSGLTDVVKNTRAAMERGQAVSGGCPMIIRIGSDLIDITRVEKVIERHGGRFLSRIFTDVERARAERRASGLRLTPSVLPPRRPARKGARHRHRRRGVWWRDMGVVNLPGGHPTMRLTGGALKRLEA